MAMNMEIEPFTINHLGSSRRFGTQNGSYFPTNEKLMNRLRFKTRWQTLNRPPFQKVSELRRAPQPL